MQRSSLTELPAPDTAIVVEYLTTAAGVFAEAGLFHVGSPTDFRINVFGLEAEGSRILPSLSHLRRNHTSDFLEFLINRYGEGGLSLSLSRLALAPQLIEAQRILACLGQNLLAKGNLLFNRPFYIYLGGICQRKTFYSSVLIELVATIAESSEALEPLIKRLRLMNPSTIADTSASDDAVDLRLATHLGFEGLAHNVIPQSAEKRLVRCLANVFQCLAETLADVIQQLRFNCQSSGLNQLALACDSMQGEATRLLALKLPEESNLEAWDHYRHTLTRCVLLICGNLDQLSTELPAILQASNDTKPPKLMYPASAKRRLISTLMTRGITSGKAYDASEALINYCQNYGVSPRQVLASELPKVHLELDQESLLIFSKIIPDQLIDASGPEEKDRTHSESLRLSQLFTSWSERFAAVLCAIIAVVFVGCGLKTAPKSDIDDFRPSIPFRNPSPNAKKQQDKAESQAGDDSPAEPILLDSEAVPPPADSEVP